MEAEQDDDKTTQASAELNVYAAHVGSLLHVTPHLSLRDDVTAKCVDDPPFKNFVYRLHGFEVA